MKREYRRGGDSDLAFTAYLFFWWGYYDPMNIILKKKKIAFRVT